jgi:hypothetical protein
MPQWCADEWHDSHDGAPADGTAWLGGGDRDRVVRSGSWCWDARGCRSAYLHWWRPDFRDSVLFGDTHERLDGDVVMAFQRVPAGASRVRAPGNGATIRLTQRNRWRCERGGRRGAADGQRLPGRLKPSGSESGDSVNRVIATSGRSSSYRPASQTLAWVDESARRLRRITDDVVIVNLPMHTVRNLSAAKYLFVRSLFFPGRRLSLDDVRAASV